MLTTDTATKAIHLTYPDLSTDRAVHHYADLMVSDVFALEDSGRIDRPTCNAIVATLNAIVAATR